MVLVVVVVGFVAVPAPAGAAKRRAVALACANRLRAAGIGPDARVAICAQRSLRLPVGLLGILKAGAAYVPLDPAYPQERLGFMLEDSGACVLLMQSDLIEALPQLASACGALWRLDDEAEWSQHGGEAPQVPGLDDPKALKDLLGKKW